MRELDDARAFMRRLGCIVVKTGGRAVEETAQEILRYLEQAGLAALGCRSAPESAPRASSAAIVSRMLRSLAYCYDWPRTRQAERGDLNGGRREACLRVREDATASTGPKAVASEVRSGRQGRQPRRDGEAAAFPCPPGFTITCQTCAEYYDAGGRFPDGLVEEIRAYTADLEAKMGKRLGDATDPLLVSVRSGAPFSMPGMMDTILNLGLNDVSVQGLIAQTGNERFAWDSYRRFVQMFSKVVLDLEGDLFENAITSMKQARGVTQRHRPVGRRPEGARRAVQGDRRRPRVGRGVPRSS